MPFIKVGKISPSLATCTYVQSAGYRLKLRSTAYENASKCNTYVEKFKFSGKGHLPHILSLNVFDVLSPEIKFWYIIILNDI